MPIYTPTFKIRIAGVEYTNEVLSNATITAGRNDFFEPTQPSYCNLELINLSGTSPAINLLDVVNIQVKDTNNVFVDLFTGEVSSVQNTLEGAGANDQYANTVQVQAIGFLGLLVKRYAGAVSYPQEFDGQHRLLALVKSQCSIYFHVATYCTITYIITSVPSFTICKERSLFTVVVTPPFTYCIWIGWCWIWIFTVLNWTKKPIRCATNIKTRL